MIWPLLILWPCLAALAALLFVGALRLTEDERDVIEHDAEIAGLGRCVRRAQQFETGPRCTGGPARKTSDGVDSVAAPRN